MADWNIRIHSFERKMAALPKPTFSICLFLFQILLLALFAKYAEYGNVEKVSSIYPRKWFFISFIFHFIRSSNALWTLRIKKRRNRGCFTPPGRNNAVCQLGFPLSILSGGKDQGRWIFPKIIIAGQQRLQNKSDWKHKRYISRNVFLVTKAVHLFNYN